MSTAVKIIFLDIDGVLNSTETAPQPREGVAAWLDPRNVAALNLVIERTGALLVVSSSWRLTTPLSQLRQALNEAGCIGVVLDVTPELPLGRGGEIQAWLDQNPSTTAWVILDDALDLRPLGHKHVHTSPLTGLEDGHLEAILLHLGGGSD